MPQKSKFKQIDPTLLMISPPMVSPASVDGLMLWLQQRLATWHIDCKHLDANLAFYNDFLWDQKRLRQTLENFEKQSKQSCFDSKPETYRQMVTRISNETSQWSERIQGLEKNLDFLRSDTFFDPETYARAKDTLDRLLLLGSLEYFPLRLEWGLFEAPNFSKDELSLFFSDPGINPFLAFYHKHMSNSALVKNANCFIFVTSSQHQQMAAASFCHALKRTFANNQAEINCMLLSPPFFNHNTDIRHFFEQCFDQCFELDHLVELLDEIKSMFKKDPIPGHAYAPDPDLNLSQYLSPVPSVNLPTPIKDMGSVTDHFKQMILGVSNHSNDNLIKILKQGALDCIGLDIPSDQVIKGIDIPQSVLSGVKQITWNEKSISSPAIKDTLVKTAKAGIWNHIEFDSNTQDENLLKLFEFVLSNPNIGHSWHVSTSSPAWPKQPGLSTVFDTAVYDKVKPLPGIPFWKRLTDPIHRLAYINRHTGITLSRLRIDPDGKTVYTLGQDLNYHFVTPEQLNPEDLDEIVHMVEAGGSVGTEFIRYNLERAYLIVYVTEKGAIVANSSLKHPRPEFIKRLFDQTGLDLTDHLERGYTSVRPEYRGLGIGTQLLDGLTSRRDGRKIFSLIGEDNIATQKIALRNNTRKVTTFFSDKMGKELGVWMPAFMLDDKSS